MKKTFRIVSLLLVVVMALAGYLPAGATDSTEFFITEVCYNANTSGDVYEYIELVNISDEAVDIRNFTITNRNDGGAVSQNDLYTAATGSVQPGQVVVIVIYQSSTAKDGVGYATSAEIDTMRTAFNAVYESDVSAESFYVAPKVTSGGGSTISGTFNLSNSAEEVVLQLLDENSTVAAEATYNAVKYNRNKYSVGFGLSETAGPRCMGITACTPGVSCEELYTEVSGDFTQTLKIMTYNVCVYGRPEDTVGTDTGLPDASLYIANRWNAVVENITNQDPDVICLNEVNSLWWSYISQSLCGEDGNYGYYALSIQGKEPGNMGQDDECTLLLYNKEKYEIVDRDTFWCSETADVAGSGRVVNWAILKDLNTGAEFVAAALHLEAHSAEAREYSASLIISRLKEISRDLPVVIMGDYNCSEGSEPYKIFVTNGFNDASRMCPEADFLATYGSWLLTTEDTGTVVPARDMNIYLPIDLFMLSENDFIVDTYRVIDKRMENVYAPSDHFPVTIEVSMKKVVPDYDLFELLDNSSHKIKNGYLYTGGAEIEYGQLIRECFDSPLYYQCSTNKTPGTEDTISLKEDPSQVITIIMKGDITGDGKIRSVDYSRIKNAFKGTVALNQEKFLAADINEDGKITSADYIKVKKHIGGTFDVFS